VGETETVKIELESWRAGELGKGKVKEPAREKN
jgi:hypothetical protein